MGIVPVVIGICGQFNTLERIAIRLPKPFPLDSLLRLAVEAAQRKLGGAADEQQEDTERSLSTLSDEEESRA